MKLIDRYIMKTVLASIGLITLMLTGLQIFMLFVNQLDDIGQGDYGIKAAAFYVLLQLPYQIYLFFPMACLLGALTGLGFMANHRELVVMRAAGLSIGQISLAVIKAALILILAVTLMGETLVPWLSHRASLVRIQALSSGQAILTAEGVWLRAGNDFIAINAVASDNTLREVYQFRFNEKHELELTRKIESITQKNGHWEAHQVAETMIGAKSIQTRIIEKMPWDVAVKPLVLKLINREPDEMSLKELHQYVKVQKSNRQSALPYQLAYWQRIFQPLTSMVMMLLAIPFIFGPLRSSSIGAKFLAGATVGFGFHLISRFFGPVSQVMQWPPIVAAVGPIVIFSLFGIYLMKRVK